MIRLSEILNEVLLGEKRAVSGVMNPNENLGALLDMLYKNFGFDNVYLSFRSSKHVGKINPNNQYGTPTGLYTYKLSNYIETPVDNLEEFRRKFPFAADRPYAQFLIVNDNIVQLNSSTPKGVLDGYVKRIMNMYPNIDPIQGLCKNWLDGSYQSYYGESKNDTHRFWLFLYDVVAYSKDRSSQNKVNMFSSLCRKLGIDSFDDDKCEGWIHPNEKCQTVFLRSNLFKGEYVLDLGKISSKSSAVDMKGSSEDKLKWLLGLSRDKVIELISRNVLGDLIIELSGHIDVIMGKLDGDILENMISNMTYSGINRLLSNSKNIGQLSELVLNAKGKNLETQTIHKLLFLNDYNFELTKRILDLTGDNITNDNITVILDDNPYAFKVSELLIDILGPKLKGSGIYSILMHSKDLVSSNGFNGLIKKLIIKTKETLNDNGILQILYHSKDPYELIDLLNEIYEGDVVSEALNQINDSYYLESMIHNKSNPDRFITYLIKTVPNKLDTSELKILFDNTKDSQKLITELLSTKEFIKSVVDSDNIFVVIDLMNRSDNPNLVKSAFGSFGDEVISRFKASGYLSMLFRKCKNCGALVDILLDSEQFLSNITSDNQFMREVLPYLMKSSDKDATIYKLLSLNGVIELLTPMLVSDILSDSSKPYELFKLILSKGYTFKEWYSDFTYFVLDRLSKVDRKNVDAMINTLMSIDKVRESVGINDLYYMLSYSNNPELVKSLFGDKFSVLVRNLYESRVLIMLAKSPDPEKLVEIYNEVTDIKSVLEDASISDIENMLLDPTNKPAIKRILDKYGVDYSKNESVKSMLRDKLITESFNFNSMTDEEQNKVFDVFKKSYEKSTGVSWDINKFRSRASNWVFFGDESGYVAVRPQASGLYKLVGVAGSPNGILSGLNELLATGRPIWGMVSNDIQGMAVKKGFKTPPPMVMRVLLKFIPKSVFGGVDFELNNDGSITMKYSDVGDAKKYFIANDAYFKKLKSDILPTMKDKLAELPMVVRKGIDMFLGEGELNESEVLTEDKLYGKKIIDATTNRIGDKSEDTLNKLAIAGLFRDQFGDIQKLRSREQLGDVFNKWYKSTISQLIKTDSFPENRTNAKRYLDAYINNIRTLGADAQKFTMNKVESGLVDVVNNNRWLGDDVSVNKGSIYEPDSEDIVYEDDELIILDSKTKARCVKYSAGESWCIGKPTLNYYNTYRLRDGATPYHVLQKNVEGNEHKMVIMNYGNRGYAIADRSNSGDRSGGPTLAKSWDKIEQEIPNLKGKEQYFKYRPVTQEEKKYSSLLSSAYKGSGFQSFIDKNTAGLVVNESEVTPEDFIRDYVVNGHTISDKQLSELRESLIESIVEAGYFLTKGVNQTDVLNDRQKRRVIRLKLENKVALTDNEVEMIKGDSVLLEKYKETVRGKLKEYLDSSSGYGRGVNKLTYGELMVLTPNEISAYVNIMDKDLVRRFLRDEGMDKIEFLREYGGENNIISSVAKAKELIKDKDEDALNGLLPHGIKVEFKYNDIIFDNIEQDRLDNNTTDLLNRLADDTWDSGYYDDYYDGNEERLDEDYETYIGQAMGNADFAEAMAFYGFGTDAKTIGENFDTYELKDGIIEVIKEVMNDASHDAKVEEWDNIHSTASEIISLDCNYRYRGSECELTMNLNSFIISNGYMLFELDDPMEDFYDALDSVLNNYLDLYDDKIPTNVDDIWERVNDYNMTPDADKIISHIIDAGDKMIEKANEDDEDDDNLDDDNKLMPIDMVIEKFKETLRGLKQSEHADKIENKLVRIQFDKRRLKRDGSVFVKMLDKTNNKTTEGYMKIDDIPTYFTNYKLAIGESVRRLLRRQLI